MTDDVGRFSSQLKSDSLDDSFRSVAENVFTDSSRSSEGYFVDIFMSDKMSTDITISGEDLNCTRWESGLLGERGDVESSQGSLLGGLENGDAPSSETGSPLPGLHEKREVPWNYLSTDSYGFLSSITEVVSFDGDGFSLNFVTPSSIVSVALDG